MPVPVLRQHRFIIDPLRIVNFIASLRHAVKGRDLLSHLAFQRIAKPPYLHPGFLAENPGTAELKANKAKILFFVPG